MKAVEVVEEPEVAKLLIDPMRRTIFSILADSARTETQLAETLGLTDSAVGHHLRAMEEVGLVKVVRKEPEIHGIIQKFYRSSALCFVIDTRNMPHDVSRYFFPMNIERIRGVLSVLQTLSRELDLDSDSVEFMSERLAVTLVEVAEKYAARNMSTDREAFTIKLYSEALLKMLGQKEKAIQPLREALGQLIAPRIGRDSRLR